MNEHGYVRKIHKKLKATKRLKRVWKINDNFQGGVPDAFYLGSDELWIEYKYLKQLPKRKTTLVVPDTSDLQVLWLKDLQESGKNAWCVVGHPGGAWIIEDLSLLAGLPCEQVIEESVSDAALIQKILYICTRSGGIDNVESHHAQKPDQQSNTGKERDCVPA